MKLYLLLVMASVSDGRKDKLTLIVVHNMNRLKML